MPASLEETCRKNGTEFYCPLGHCIVFKESEADRYRREADRLKQQLAMKDDEILAEQQRAEMERRSAAAYRGQATRLRKRAKAGVCPCCTRHFENLERHMASKHPDMSVDPEAPAENVVAFGGKTA